MKDGAFDDAQTGEQKIRNFNINLDFDRRNHFGN